MTAPPVRFVPSGQVEAAQICHCPPFARQQRYSGNRLLGVRYERKCQAYLADIFPFYVPGFWINFLGSAGWKYCQPDGVHFDLNKGIITIVEIKLQHTSDAWWQLKQLYYPALKKLFPEEYWKFQFCEIVKWYDPLVSFPVPVRLVSDPFKNTDEFKVHIWRG